MRTQNFFGLLVGAALVVCTTGCVTFNRKSLGVSTPMVVPGTTNVVYSTVTHTDRSWSVNQFGSSVGNDGSIASFRFRLGGGTPVGNQYGYGVGPGPGSYGYHSGGTYVQGLAGPAPIYHPAEVVPIEDQRFYHERTWQNYGFGSSTQPPPNFGGHGGGYGY